MNPQRLPISPVEFSCRSVSLWDDQNLLLTSGDINSHRFNTMTVGWGGFGCMWSKPFAMVVVRPQRYTYQFMEDFPTFTLCAFAAEYQAALTLLGTKSGRDGDKIAESGLTPIPSAMVAAPAFAEAELIIECQKTYWQDLDPGHFLDPAIALKYPSQDYHRIYFGQIVSIQGTPIFQAS